MAAAACWSLLLLVVILTVVNAAPGKSRWRRQTTSNTTITAPPPPLGTCPMIPSCNDGSCIHDNAECHMCGPASVKSSDFIKCISCELNCANCTISGQDANGIDITECTACKTGYVMDTNKACISCGTTYTWTCELLADSTTKALTCDERISRLMMDKCHLCGGTCDTCVAFVNNATTPATVKTNCTKCAVGFGFGGNKPTCSSCPLNCDMCDETAGKCDTRGCRVAPTAYGLTTERQCSSCSPYCSSCIDTAAGECDSGKCMTSALGLIGTGLHLYPVTQDTDRVCKLCSTYCVRCTIPGQCSECVKGYFLDGTKCTKCLTNCKECTSISLCTNCKDGFVKETSASNVDTCKACSTMCLTCKATEYLPKKSPSELECETCFPRFQLNSGVPTCDACPQFCTSCNQQGTCLDCFPLYASYGAKCLKCPDNCQACTADISGNVRCDSNQCLKDKTGQGRIGDSAGQCVFCPTKCSSCTIDNNGVTSCLYGYCQTNTVWNPADKQCKACDIHCDGICAMEPTTENTLCAQCATGYTLTTTYTCAACPANCDTCWWDSSVDKTWCYESGCNFGSYEMITDAGKSVNSDISTSCTASGITGCKVAVPVTAFETTSAFCQMCEPGTVNTTSGCLTCSSQMSNCAKCTANGATTTCTECNSNSAPVTPANSVTISSCTSCSNMVSNCEICTVADSCTNCLATFNLYSATTCVACHSDSNVPCTISGSYISTSSCPTGYIELNDGCQQCPTGCTGCTLTNGVPACSSCSGGYILEVNKCTPCTTSSMCATCTSTAAACATCGNADYLDGSVCKDCMSNCLNCNLVNSVVECSQCKSGTTLDKKSDGTHTCVACNDIHCDACVHNATNADPAKCSTCKSGYAKTSTFTCLKCDDYCDKCTQNATDLLKTVCRPGQCSKGYVMEKGPGAGQVKCKHCGIGCDFCHLDVNGPNGVWCDFCGVDDASGISYHSSPLGNCTSMKDNSCVYSNSSTSAANCDDDGCIPGYVSIWSSTNNKYECTACPNSGNCTKCKEDPNTPGSTICIDGFCVAGTVFYQDQCYGCPSNCATCQKNSSQVTCTTCNRGWAVNDHSDDCTACDNGCLDCGNGPDVLLNCITCAANFLAPDSTYNNCSECSLSCTQCRTINVAGQCDLAKCDQTVRPHNRTQTTLECTYCGDGCAECTDLSVDVTQACTKCQNGYTTDFGQNCTACIAGCKVCAADDPYTCTECYPTHYKDGTTCVECTQNCTGGCNGPNTCNVGACVSGYGAFIANVGDNATCNACPDNCNRCDTDVANCDLGHCAANFTHDDLNAGQCKRIHCDTYGSRVKQSDYMTCQAAITKCNVAVEGGGSCPQGSCQRGSVWNSGSCLTTGCPTNCANCYIDVDGNPRCDNNGCNLNYGVTPGGKCMSCPSKCKFCSWNGVNNMVCNDCMDRNYALVPANTCLRCPDNCNKCTPGSIEYCTDCDAGYVLNEVNHLCVQCTSQCAECGITVNELVTIDGASVNVRTLKTSCLRCNAHYRRALNSDGVQTCYVCTGGCMQCDINTATCDVNKCYSGYVQGSDNKCYSCPSSCSKTCVYDSSLSSNTYCPTTTAMFSFAGQLKYCSNDGPSSCSRCASNTVCKQNGCKSTHRWKDGYCAQKHEYLGVGCKVTIGDLCHRCHEGYFMTRKNNDVDRDCKKCETTNCKTCVDNTLTVATVGTSKCTACDNGFYLNGTVCTACPSALNCTTCSMSGSSVKCKTCAASHYQTVNSECWPCNAEPCQCETCTKCISGYFMGTTTCTVCNTTCATCSDASKCDTCKPATPFKDSLNYCFKCKDVNAWNCEQKTDAIIYVRDSGCNPGYAVSQDKLTCLKCPTDCTTCNYNMTCTICDSGFLINNEQCGRCPLNCKTCQSSAVGNNDLRKSLECTVCDDRFAVFDRKCYQCPANCANCTAAAGLTSTSAPVMTCTNCIAKTHGLNNGQCELCSVLTTTKCYTCDTMVMSSSGSNTTTTSSSYKCTSCSSPFKLSMDNKTCVDCTPTSCGSGFCAPRPLCSECKANFTIDTPRRECSTSCYNYTCKGAAATCAHLGDKRKDFQNSLQSATIIKCLSDCYIYTKFPVGQSRETVAGCIDHQHDALNIDLVPFSTDYVNDCKGKTGNPEICGYRCNSIDPLSPCFSSATEIIPLMSLMFMAVISIWLLN